MPGDCHCDCARLERLEHRVAELGRLLEEATDMLDRQARVIAALGLKHNELVRRVAAETR
jgi:uncharacterized coiled-coil protein SlyX